MGSITPTPTVEKLESICSSRIAKGGTNSCKICQHNFYTNARKTGSIYPGCSVKRGTNSSKMGSITPTPTAEKRGAFTLAVV